MSKAEGVWDLGTAMKEQSDHQVKSGVRQIAAALRVAVWRHWGRSLRLTFSTEISIASTHISRTNSVRNSKSETKSPELTLRNNSRFCSTLATYCSACSRIRAAP